MTDQALITERSSVVASAAGTIWSARAVLLDLDGTLVDTTPAVEAAWRRLGEQLGIDWEVIKPLAHGIPAPQVLAAIAPGLPAVERDRLAVTVLEEQAASEEPVTYLPGAAKLVAALDGVPWAVVTSGNRALAGSSLRKVGLAVPPVLVTADDVAVGKPDPTPFLQAARLLGVPAVDCVIVEDSPAGVAAGLAAGVRVIAVTHTHRAEQLADATVVCPDLPEVEADPAAGTIRLRLAS